jgi:oxygen-independent coproporphyrinogen-3 oxidase
MDALYVHIPFCLARKCLYCDFVSMPYSRAVSERYLAALAKEISLVSSPGDKKAPIKSLFIGGGTPTALDAGQLGGLMKAVRGKFVFCQGAEVTAEANPATIGQEEKLRVLAEEGVNRISIGVQSFNDRELKTLGRPHSSHDALDAVRGAREAGFKEISIDLIYGIPGQTEEDWKRTLQTASGLEVGHISAYELTLEEDTPLSGLVKKGEVLMPAEDETLRLYFLACETLEGAGYVHYEVSNYALPGRESLHNMNYWRRGEYIGVGAAAHSFVNGKRWKNTDDIFKYMDTLEMGMLPLEDITELKPEEEKREFVFLGLRTREGLSVPEGKDLFGMDIEGAAVPLVKEGLLEISDGRLRATRAGVPLLNTVVLRLLAGLGL